MSYKKYEVELILKPTGKYIGCRYIKIDISADSEEEASKFAVETMSVILTSDVEITVKKVKEI